MSVFCHQHVGDGEDNYMQFWRLLFGIGYVFATQFFGIEIEQRHLYVRAQMMKMEHTWVIEWSIRKPYMLSVNLNVEM